MTSSATDQRVDLAALANRLDTYCDACEGRGWYEAAEHDPRCDGSCTVGCPVAVQIQCLDSIHAASGDIRNSAATLKAIVDGQAEDEGLWFFAQTAPEAYLQQELRRLHAAIEAILEP